MHEQGLLSESLSRAVTFKNTHKKHILRSSSAKTWGNSPPSPYLPPLKHPPEYERWEWNTNATKKNYSSLVCAKIKMKSCRKKCRTTSVPEAQNKTLQHFTFATKYAATLTHEQEYTGILEDTWYAGTHRNTQRCKDTQIHNTDTRRIYKDKR